jgi:integrase
MTRRGPHEGSIYQRGDGRWAASLHVGYEGGRRVRKSFYGRTREHVRDQLSRAARDLQDGMRPGNARLTLAAYLGDWLAEARTSVRPSTFRRYEQIARNQLIPQLGRIALPDLKPADVEAMTRRLLEKASPRSAAHARAVLRTALSRALRHQLVHRNVAALAAPPRVEHREVESYDPEQVRAFLAGIRGDPLEAVYVLAIATGLRQGELLGLQWSDVDLDQRVLTVRAALQRINGQPTLVETKTARSRRTVPLPGLAVTALREQRLRGRPLGYVFTDSRGMPLHGTGVTRSLHAVQARLGLPAIRFHALRHTAASLLLAQGVHPRVVMEMLGHSTIALTMNTYSHVIPALQREAADTMDTLLGS